LDPALTNTLGARIFRATVSGAAVKGFKTPGLSKYTFKPSFDLILLYLYFLHIFDVIFLILI
jgi:hypothetical protein